MTEAGQPGSSRVQAALLAIVVALGAAAFVVWGTPTFDVDGRAIYAATLAATHGVSPWDHQAQVALMSEAVGQPREVLPFGYPPWYVLLCLPMGWLPYEQAERLFMVYNMAWFALGTWLLSVREDGEIEGRLAALVGTYPPLLGLIAVGQMAMPVFAGVGLALYGLRRRRPWLLALAALLLSFKWHIGALPGLFFLALLWRERALFWRTLGPGLGLFAVASVAGMALDPRWPLTYAESVLTISGLDMNQVCDTCGSLSWTASVWTGLSAGPFALAILAAGTVAMVARGLLANPRAWMGAAVALTLMCLPYCRNYDYAVFGVTLVIAYEHARSAAERALVVACSVGTFSLLLLPRTATDEVLGSTALALFVLLLIRGPDLGESPTAPGV